MQAVVIYSMFNVVSLKILPMQISNNPHKKQGCSERHIWRIIEK